MQILEVSQELGVVTSSVAGRTVGRLSWGDLLSPRVNQSNIIFEFERLAVRQRVLSTHIAGRDDVAHCIFPEIVVRKRGFRLVGI